VRCTDGMPGVFTCDPGGFTEPAELRTQKDARHGWGIVLDRRRLRGCRR
jgi:hypothetical protein